MTIVVPVVPAARVVSPAAGALAVIAAVVPAGVAVARASAIMIIAIACNPIPRGALASRFRALAGRSFGAVATGLVAVALATHDITTILRTCARFLRS